MPPLPRPSAGLAAYVAGTWQVQRSLLDRRNARTGEFTGTATFVPDGVTLHYEEVGQVCWPPHHGPARRAYRYETDGWRADVFFDDGRFFHHIDVRDGAAHAEHLCGSDTYYSAYRFDAGDHWHVVWRVLGPAKDLELSTHYRREGKNLS